MKNILEQEILKAKKQLSALSELNAALLNAITELDVAHGKLLRGRNVGYEEVGDILEYVDAQCRLFSEQNG